MTIVSKPNDGSVIAEEGIVSPAYQKFFDEVEETVNDIITGAGFGDVFGPSISGIDGIAVFSNTSGKLIKDSGKKVSDFGDVSGPGIIVTNTGIAIFDQTTGKLIKDSGVPINDVATNTSPNTFTNKNYDANATGNFLRNVDIEECIAASKLEAEAGIDNTKILTSLRVKEAITAQAGDVNGPAGVAADDNIAVFNQTTGKLIKDGGRLRLPE